LRGEANQLLSIIDDILDLSRLETGKLTLQRMTLPVNDVVHSAVECARSNAEKHDVQLAEELEAESGTVSIDEVKIRQILLNLLIYAIQFSPEGGVVRARTRRDGDFAVIEVIDEGPGIQPEECAHIFELFGQGIRPSERHPTGLGVGLHLVKRIAELHGGHVGVNSTGEASTFWVRIPSVEVEQTAERAA
jgi:signal transduction histidine kinase